MWERKVGAGSRLAVRLASSRWFCFRKVTRLMSSSLCAVSISFHLSETERRKKIYQSSNNKTAIDEFRENKRNVKISWTRRVNLPFYARIDDRKGTFTTRTVQFSRRSNRYAVFDLGLVRHIGNHINTRRTWSIPSHLSFSTETRTCARVLRPIYVIYISPPPLFPIFFYLRLSVTF